MINYRAFAPPTAAVSTGFIVKEQCSSRWLTLQGTWGDSGINVLASYPDSEKEFAVHQKLATRNYIKIVNVLSIFIGVVSL